MPLLAANTKHIIYFFAFLPSMTGVPKILLYGHFSEKKIIIFKLH